MKVAYDHQVFSLQRHGGISRYFAELVRNLALRFEGVEATVVAPVHINEYLLSEGVRERVRGWHLPLDFRGNARIAKKLNTVLLPLFWRKRTFDVLHETYYSHVTRGSGRVRVLTIYDMIHELFPSDFPDSVKVMAAKRASARRADHIICISETTRQDAMRILGIAPERSSVIYLGSSLRAGRAPNGLNDDIAPCVLYVGQRSGYKNFSVVLEAFASSERLRAKFTLIAFGGRSFAADEIGIIEKFKLGNGVRHVVGDDTLLQRYYRAAAAFVYPSRYEGFGIPPLEAMASGCPVACSNAGSISEVLGDAGAYFDPDDSEQLRAILERLTEDGEYADDLRAKGFQCVQKYSWERCAGETLGRYRQLAAPAS